MRKQVSFIEIPLPLYRMAVVVSIATTFEQIIARGVRCGIEKKCFKKEWKRSVEDMVEAGCKGFCCNFGEENRDVLVWLRERPKTATEFSTLYHELSHAVDNISYETDKKNLWFSEEGISEPRAYLYDYLVTECNKILWNL